jgi:hypothetical protein
MLQQGVKNAWQPPAFFSKKSAQQKYSSHERELLAVCVTVKHFHHMLEGRRFIVFTEHKPIS